jgi:hypothetical protein
MAGVEGYFKIRIYGINLDTDKEKNFEFDNNLQNKIIAELENSLENIVMKSSSLIERGLEDQLKGGYEPEYEVEFVKSKK